MSVDGLPLDLRDLISNFKDAEKWEDPLEVLQVMFRIHASVVDPDNPDMLESRNKMISLSVSSTNLGHFRETYNLRTQSAYIENEAPPNLDAFKEELKLLANVQTSDPS